jgi:hypothetical protein
MPQTPQKDLRDAIRDSRIAVELRRLRSIRPNCLLDCGARKAMRRSASLLPLLQGSFRNLQLQRGVTLREILALTPPSQLARERMSGQTLMPRMMRSCPEGHCLKYDAIRESRIASSSQLEFYCARRASLVATTASNQRRRERPTSRLEGLAGDTGAACSTAKALYVVHV